MLFGDILLPTAAIGGTILKSSEYYCREITFGTFLPSGISPNRLVNGQIPQLFLNSSFNHSLCIQCVFSCVFKPTFWELNMSIFSEICCFHREL